MPNPVNSTYDTKIVPLLSIEDQRDYSGTTDDIMINFLPEIMKKPDGTEIDLVKRDGCSEVIATTGTGVNRGIYFWPFTSQIYVAIDTDIYIYNSTYTIRATLSGLFASGTTQVGFTEFLYEDGTQTLVCTDGIQLYEISTANVPTASTTVATVVGNHIPTPVYYDGYILLVKAGTGDCYNTDTNTALNFTAGNFITSEINPDTVSNITKVNNYFVLLGRSSFEYFYDAGNPTGTPFARNDVFVKNTGYVDNSAATYGNKVFLVGYQTNATPDAYVLEDFKLTSISTPSMRRWLSAIPVTNIHGNITSINGHDIYLITDSVRSYYYDINMGIWGRLAWQGSAINFPFKYSTRIISNDANLGYETLFTTYLDNSVSLFSPDLYQDKGVDFQCIVRTKVLNFGTNNNKFMSSLAIWGDRKSTGDVSIEVSDDDYQTYSTARTVALNQERPNLQQWGRFRRRSFRLIYRTNAPLRIRNLEVDLNMGVT